MARRRSPRTKRREPTEDPGTSRLVDEHCHPKHKRRLLDAATRRALHRQVPAWRMRKTLLTRSWRLEDFDHAFKLARRAARLAKAEDHHPDIHLESFDTLRLELSTRVAGGLTRNDFILAAHIDRAAKGLERPQRPRRRKVPVDFVPVPFLA